MLQLTKQYALPLLTAYSLFMSILLNIFGIVLSYQEQFYQWNIIDMKSARYELFKTAFQHCIIFFFCVGFKLYKSYKNFNSINQFKSVQSYDDDSAEWDKMDSVV